MSIQPTSSARRAKEKNDQEKKQDIFPPILKRVSWTLAAPAKEEPYSLQIEKLQFHQTYKILFHLI
ncbi:hypothetical protein HMI54_004492 [Coelomomyces lativittatus]|nr:hypothetical protein HMI54_004492 [Coelomomyces lativittatus]